MQNCLIIIQARMRSSRLPHKVLLPFFEAQTILDVQLQMLSQFVPNLPLVVATSTHPADDAILEFCKTRNTNCFRGSENDVLDRFIACAQHFDADHIIRICSDNPFLNGHYIKELIVHATQNNADYVSYKNHLGTPAIKTHWGIFAEVVKTKALQKAASLTKEMLYREHVTNYLYGNSSQFAIHLQPAPNVILHRQDLRFTIDTPQDFSMAQQLFTLCDGQDLAQLIQTVDAHSAFKNSMLQGIKSFSK